MKPIDKAIAILGRSNDGDDLTALDLKLCEMGANGQLNEKGLEVLDTLYQTVIAGEYVRSQDRWMHGIEHLTQDNDGYVLWRGARIEHYSFSDRTAERAAAMKLAERCRSLEARGIPVNWHTATSKIFENAPADTPWVEAILNLYCILPDDDGKANWAIFHGKQSAVAIGRDGRDIGIRVYRDTDRTFATHEAYLSLEVPEVHRAKKVDSYDSLMAAFAEIGLTPQLVKRARAELAEELIEQAAAPAPCPA